MPRTFAASTTLVTDGSNIMVENKERVKRNHKPLTKQEWVRLLSNKKGGDNTNGEKSQE